MSRRRIEQDLAEQIPYLRRYARLLAGPDRGDADDLVQETLLKAISSLDRFRAGAELRAWLTTIMINTYRSERRRARTRRAYLEAQPLDEPGGEPTQQAWMELQSLTEALAKLPPEQREAITLMAVEDVRYVDAARILNVKLGTFMSRIARGRAALRRLLDGQPEAPRKAVGGMER